MNGRYLIRTFGCQMNEHDSERIAGLLESDGYVRAEDAAEAQVVVFNTCAVRENADNRLYGNLGHLRPLKQANPRLRIVVAGCLAQKDQGQIQERAPWVDVVVGTHALPGLLELLRRAEVEGPQMDVREFTEVFPSALPARREVAHHAWVSIAMGCDNHCTFCIVPLVRGPQLSREIGDVLTEVQGLARRGVVEVTLLGQNVNTYGRDLTVPGSSRKPLFAELLRVVDEVEDIRRIRFTSPHPHDFTPDVIEAMAECEKVCEHIHFPLQSGSDRILRAMQRSYRSERYLSWLERIREAVPGMAVTTDIIVGFPGEAEEDFRSTLDVVRAARFDQAFTFQYSPRPGTPAGTMPDQVPKEVVQERFDRLVELQESISLERMRATVGCTFEVLVEGVGRKGGVQGRTRTNKVVHLPGTIAPGTFLDARIVAAHPHHLNGEMVGVTEAGAGGGGLAPRARRRPLMPGARSFLALVGPTASGKSEAGVAIASRLGAEIVSVDSMLVYRGMDVGTAKPTSAERAGVPHHLVDVADPSDAFSVARYQALARVAVEDADARGRSVLLVGGSGLYFRAVVDDLEFPATDPVARDELRAEAEALGPDRLYERLAELDPAAAARIEPSNVRRTVRALEVAAVTGRPFSSYSERWEHYPDERVRAAGIDVPRDVLGRRIEGRVRGMVDAGLLDEVRALLDRGLFGWLTASRAIGYAEFARHLHGELSLEEATAETVKRTRELARRQMVWFRRDPRIRWFPAGERGATEIVDELTGYLQGD